MQILLKTYALWAHGGHHGEEGWVLPLPNSPLLKPGYEPDGIAIVFYSSLNDATANTKSGLDC